MPNQRPAAPWSFHHWWGQWDSASDLPNSSGAAAQYGREVQAGDIAWVNDQSRLFVCESAAVGHASWTPFSGGGMGDSNLVLVNSPSDFPAASGGVRTLLDGHTYLLTRDIDLNGDRLVSGQNTAILGTSSENARLRSTGLVGTALITSQFSLPMQNLTIEADVAVDLDADGTPLQALDWFAVNFANCPQVGRVRGYANTTLLSCAFLHANGLVLEGSVGTLAANQCLFSAAAPGAPVIQVAATAVVQRRFRIIYSSFIVPPGSTGIEVDPAAAIPVEGYILDTVNFAGGGTYTAGVSYSDNKSQFINCRGVPNSASICQYTMLGNAIATVISGVNSFVKAAGPTLPGAFVERFSLSDNRATYQGALTGFFRVTATLSVTSGNNNQIRARVALNGTTVPSSESVSTTGAGGRVEGLSCQGIVELQGGAADFVEIWLANGTGVTNVTVTDLNVILERLN
jgi:hypothetical protein